MRPRIDYELVGERIKRKRRELGLSQEFFAEKMDVSTAYFSRVERGISKVSLGRIAQIASLLQMPIDELITGVTKEQNIYLDREFKELFSKCSKDKLKLIYNIAKIVSGVKFV